MTYVENILSVFDRATPNDITEGSFWYNAANALAWELDPFKPWQGAAVIASLSPRLRWDKNAMYARMAYNLKGYDVAEVANYIPTLNNSRVKALRMVNGEHWTNVLGNGLKTNAFMDNILNPYTSERVTVDKHAFNIACGERTGYNVVIKDKDYREVEAAYRTVGNIVNLPAHTVQAITWVAWRNLSGEVS